MSYPERRGRSIGHAAQGAFVVVAILFAAGMFAVGVYVGQNSEPHTEETAEVAQGEDSEGDTTAEVGEDEEEAETEETETEAAEEEEAEPEDVSGAEIFAAAGCANCHNLDAAGSEGSVGPDLDETNLDREGIEQIVRQGQGAMPAFEGNLSDPQIEAVADYVAESIG